MNHYANHCHYWCHLQVCKCIFSFLYLLLSVCPTCTCNDLGHKHPWALSILCGLLCKQSPHTKERKLLYIGLSQLQLNDTTSLSHRVVVSHILLRVDVCVQCAMCMVSPEYNQSNMCYGIWILDMWQHAVYIRESVDSLCRDGAGTPIVRVRWKAC